MELFLCAAAFFFFYAGHPASALLMRCGLEASHRFSPRAALALSSIAALSGAFAGLACRGGLRAVPSAQRAISAAAGLIGGTMGRAGLLMLTARYPSTLTLSRIQMVPLLLLAFVSLIPEERGGTRLSLSPLRLFAVSLLCGAADGFFGAGGMPLFALTALGGVQRRRDTPSCSLLTALCAQGGALLLTLLCGAAQVFPARMLLLLPLGTALGVLAAEKQKERGALHHGMRTALRVYLVLAACSCIEQAI